MRAPLAPLREPDTIVARPSAVTWSRLVWLTVSVLVSSTWLVAYPWAPWLFIPLLCAAAVTDGWESACFWALAAGLLTDLTPPASSTPGLSAVPLLAAAIVAARVRSWWTASLFTPLAAGAVSSFAGLVVLIGLRSEAAGALIVDARDDLLCVATTGVLTALVVPLWVRWATKLRMRGRA